MRHTISALVQNHSGVLTRICGLFSSRGFNIESLAVGETADPEYSRMTLVVSGDDQVLDQVQKQLSKLVEVIKVGDLKADRSVTRELALVKVKAQGNKRLEVVEYANVFRGKVVDLSAETVTVEITGTRDKVEAFLELMHPLGVLELARTGSVGMHRGSEIL